MNNNVQAANRPTRLALYNFCPFRTDGVAKVMLDLANGLIARGCEVDYLCVDTQGPLADHLDRGVRVIALPSRGFFQRILHVARYLRAQRPVALISAMDIANLCILAKIIAPGPTKVVTTVHVPYSFYLKKRGGLVRFAGALLLRWTLPKADAIVTVSKGVADDLARFYKAPDKTFTIYNTLDAEKARSMADQPLQHEWFAANQPPVILSAGRLEKEKDFSSLIRAFKRVRQEREARLVILGEGSQRPLLEALVAELGLDDDVQLLGYVDNPYNYMARSSVFVLSSVAEGFASVLLEAMAVGTPIVSTNCPGGPREVLDNGKYGHLVPVGDVNALAQAIQQTIAEVKQPALLRSRAEEFTQDTALDQYIRVSGLGPGALPLLDHSRRA